MPKLAMRLGKLHGYILNTIYGKYGLEPDYKNIMTIKKEITGTGKASKEMVAESIYKLYPYLRKELVFAESTAITKGRYKTDDIFDAIAICLTKEC